MKHICIYHSRDLDGWMSAAIVKLWWDNCYDNNKNTNGNIFSKADFVVEKDKIRRSDVFSIGDQLFEFLGWDYGDNIPDLSIFDKIIMCDISFPPDEMNKLVNVPDDPRFVWIDHHISSISNPDINDNWILGLRDPGFAACELTWKYLFPKEDMPELVRLLGRYDCFGHKGTKEEKKVLEFQYGARQFIFDYQTAYFYLSKEILHRDGAMISFDSSWDYIHKQGIAIYAYLCTEAKQIYAKAFSFEFKEVINGNFVCREFLIVNHERFNPVNFGINYHEHDFDGFGCFWYKKGKWFFSLYNDDGRVDCSNIAYQYGGGGHKGAAGFQLKNIDSFLNKK